MTAVERLKAICKNIEMPISKLERECGFSNGYIGQLRKGTLPDDRLKIICELLGISPEYLMGYANTTECPICHQAYDPANVYSLNDHLAYHDKYIAAQKEYGELPTYATASRTRTEAIEAFRDKSRSDNVRIDAFEAYLDADFYLRIYRSDFSSGLDREEIARTEIETLQPDYVLSASLINKIRMKHGLSELPHELSYYYDNDVKEIADFLMKSPEYRVLFDAARKVKPEDIDLIKNLIEKMR